MDDDLRSTIYEAAHVRPSPRQLAWQKREFMAFIHFGPNTFTGQQWGSGQEDPAVFHPTALNGEQWVQVCVDAGMRELILTAKHHDGFCLWPSQYTDHSTLNCPWKDGQGDLVREVADACARAGLGLGIYLSPWDRHEPTYGTAAYNDYFVNQLTELLTGYGPVSEVWFDGACGEGPNGKRQVYDWPRYYRLIRRLQPGAVISIMGPDVRWCGNEAGRVRESEWSVVPAGERAQEQVAARSQQDDVGGLHVPQVDPRAEDIGSLEKIRHAEPLAWYPAQVNTSIRPNWFYDPRDDERVKTLDHLLDIYFGSVGGNATFLLNFPPDRRGLIHENDAARARELGRVLRETFEHNLALGTRALASHVRDDDPRYGADKAVDGSEDTYWTTDDWAGEASVEIDLGEKKTFNVAMLKEYVQAGQRVEHFLLEAWDGEAWNVFARSTVVGYKRLLRFDPVTARKVRLRITGARVCPTLSHIGLYVSPYIGGME
jgi:alpha-L-fucosidase